MRKLSPEPDNAVKPRIARPRYDQATKIIAKFGGEARFAEIVGIHRVTAYRWKSSNPWGTDGLIPHHQVDKIKAVARNYGVLLTDYDWAPNLVDYSGVPEGPYSPDPFPTLTFGL